MYDRKDLKKLHLEPFSLRFAKRVFELHPEWWTFATSRERIVEGLSVFTLEINFPSENPSVSEPLTIDADLDRIIAVRWFHQSPTYRWNIDFVTYIPGVWERLAPDLRADENLGFDALVKYAEQFLEEKQVAFYTDQGALSRAPELIQKDVDGIKWGVFRSWRGTYDLTVGSPPIPTSAVFP